MFRLANLGDAEFEKLPFGAIRIDHAGTILSYNQYEARLAHLDAARVVGKNFFRDIAPCTAVREFEGRMRDFIRSTKEVSFAFDYVFPFKPVGVNVTITFVKLPDDQILIAVERIEPALA